MSSSRSPALARRTYARTDRPGAGYTALPDVVHGIRGLGGSGSVAAGSAGDARGLRETTPAATWWERMPASAQSRRLGDVPETRRQDMPTRVGINGFGRTGRATFRAA